MFLRVRKEWRMSKTSRSSFSLQTDKPVFFASVAVILAFVVVTFLFGDWVGEVFGNAATWIMTNLGWFYIAGVSIFLIFLVLISASRYGHVRLGSDEDRPEYSTLAWFAMLFAAGIGTILMFWGVAEPVSHFATPPMGDVEPESLEAADQATAFTLYHFGLHTWTIFALPALAFAYFIYKRKMPPRMSSIFSPLLGRHVYGPIGKFIDIVALVGTVFGVATSVGLGTMQINAGLSKLFGIEVSALVQVSIIVVVMLVASISVIAGLDKGVKRLSNFNIAMAIGLLVFVVLAGPTVLLLKGTVESFGIYLANLPELMFWNNTRPVDESLVDWQNTWTVFYWAWTITWAPFVGIFIARISRGRTVRQFIFGVLALPVTFSVIWFGVFATASFEIEMNGEGGLVDAVVTAGDIPGALFEFLSNYPLAIFVSGAAILIVLLFFITSVDSASIVVDMLASGRGDEHSPAFQRLLWVVLMSAVAAAILVGAGEGGLVALQNVITVVGLPFFIIGFIMMGSLMVALRNDLGNPIPVVTRQWDEATSPEEWERNEEAPSPEPIGPTHQIPDEGEDTPKFLDDSYQEQS